MSYTSDNDPMFTLYNKACEIGIRLSKEDCENFKAKHQSTIYKSYTAVMRGYVSITEHLYDNIKLLTHNFNTAHEHIPSLDPK